MLETTSPSASLFASIDRSRALLEAARPGAARRRPRHSRALARELIGAIDGVHLLDDGVLAHPSVGARDPLKLIIDVSATLADGIAVDRSLNERGIRLEGADRRTLVPLLTIGDDEARVRRLATRAGRGDRREPRRPQRGAAHRDLVADAARAGHDARARRSSRRASACASTDAVGRVSAELIAPYPPGIPALAPGEVVSAELVAALRGEVAGGTRMAGVSDATLETLFVVA